MANQGFGVNLNCGISIDKPLNQDCKTQFMLTVVWHVVWIDSCSIRPLLSLEARQGCWDWKWKRKTSSLTSWLMWVLKSWIGRRNVVSSNGSLVWRRSWAIKLSSCYLVGGHCTVDNPSSYKTAPDYCCMLRHPEFRSQVSSLKWVFWGSCVGLRSLLMAVIATSLWLFLSLMNMFFTEKASDTSSRRRLPRYCIICSYLYRLEQNRQIGCTKKIEKLRWHSTFHWRTLSWPVKL